MTAHPTRWTHPTWLSSMPQSEPSAKSTRRSAPVLLEPIMRVVVETPSEFQGAVLGSLNQRRGIIQSTSEDGVFSMVEAEVPLSEMFGYSTVLRSSTQGKAEFTMEFSRYNVVPKALAEEIIKKEKENRK